LGGVVRTMLSRCLSNDSLNIALINQSTAPKTMTIPYESGLYAQDN